MEANPELLSMEPAAAAWIGLNAEDAAAAAAAECLSYPPVAPLPLMATEVAAAAASMACYGKIRC